MASGPKRVGSTSEVIHLVLDRGKDSDKFKASDKSKVMNIEHANSKGSALPQPASENSKDEQKKNGNKKKKGKGKGKGNSFRVEGNKINGGKADKCGVFGFGNKYYSGKKPKEDESSEEESDSSDEDRE